MNPQLLYAELRCLRHDLLTEAAASSRARIARGSAGPDGGLVHRAMRAYLRLWWASRPREVSLEGLLVMSTTAPRGRLRRCGNAATGRGR